MVTAYLKSYGIIYTRKSAAFFGCVFPAAPQARIRSSSPLKRSSFLLWWKNAHTHFSNQPFICLGYTSNQCNTMLGVQMKIYGNFRWKLPLECKLVCHMWVFQYIAGLAYCKLHAFSRFFCDNCMCQKNIKPLDTFNLVFITQRFLEVAPKNIRPDVLHKCMSNSFLGVLERTNFDFQCWQPMRYFVYIFLEVLNFNS